MKKKIYINEKCFFSLIFLKKKILTWIRKIIFILEYILQKCISIIQKSLIYSKSQLSPLHSWKIHSWKINKWWEKEIQFLLQHHNFHDLTPWYLHISWYWKTCLGGLLTIRDTPAMCIDACKYIYNKKEMP